jgi:coproporphyrinogen III oxidase-like Fe-S oxidoreductase
VKRLSDENRAVEYLMMSLRLTEGCDLARYAVLRGVNPARDPHQLALIQDGFLHRDGDILCTQPKPAA